MRLGLSIGYSGRKMELPMDLILEADRLGYHSVWASESYGSDVFTPLAWIAARTEQIRLGTAIAQMPARTPAMTAMTAMTLDDLSGGRMILGLGLSGPQVVEGWHGKPFTKPLEMTREYVDILRQIFAREAPMTHQGYHFQIPYEGDDAMGLGKPLKSILHGRGDLPIYIASLGPKNVQLTAEIADGWLPVFFAPERYPESFKESVEAGFAEAGNGKSIEQFDIAPFVPVSIHADLQVAYNQVKPGLALYIGGMGAKEKNFYNQLTRRYGFEEAADVVQEHFMAGEKAEAMMAVPDELVDAVALCGPRERVAERLTMWRESDITTLNVQTFDIETVRIMAELVL